MASLMARPREGALDGDIPSGRGWRWRSGWSMLAATAVGKWVAECVVRVAHRRGGWVQGYDIGLRRGKRVFGPHGRHERRGRGVPAAGSAAA